MFLLIIDLIELVFLNFVGYIQPKLLSTKIEVNVLS